MAVTSVEAMSLAQMAWTYVSVHAERVTGSRRWCITTPGVLVKVYDPDVKPATERPPTATEAPDETNGRGAVRTAAPAKTPRLTYWILPVFAVGGIVGPWWFSKDSERAALTARSSAVPITSANSEQPATPLGLEMTPRDRGIEIRWDKRLPAVAGADSGLLQIVDGGAPMELPLAHSELLTGRLLYVAKSGDIHVRLTVFAASGAVQDILRVVHAPGLSARYVPRASALTAPLSSQSPAQPATVQTAEPRRAADPGPVRQSAHPPGDDPPVINAIAGMPPAHAPTAQTRVPPPNHVPTAINAATPLVAQPQSTEATAGVTERPIVAERPPIPAATKPATREPIVKPPVPARQFNPVVPAHLRPIIPDGATVEVRMKIDAAGNVKEVTTPAADSVISRLAPFVRAAAQAWKFQPATIDGTPVPAEHVVFFKFSRR